MKSKQFKMPGFFTALKDSMLLMFAIFVIAFLVMNIPHI